MELKPYQQQVINDLHLFLEHLQKTKNIADAFYNFWSTHPRTPLQPFVGKAIEPYKNNVPKVPNICIKVPTAGGKTFIACNAIYTILQAFSINKIKAVVWLVPSITILEQTLKNLKDSHHPYRQKINVYFNNRVEVFDKTSLLQGTGFNTTSIKEQLNIFVFSFDSIRTKNKEGRKVYEENGNLQNFETLVGKNEEISLMKIIHQLNPLLIVDESHNAETELSIDMLKAFNPCFILDLTATPRKNSNIISFIDSIELKKENMVKLPVIVYNHPDKTEVVNSSLQLQKRLEIKAIEAEKMGGKYIRPIVLFQVQPKNGGDFLHEEEEKNNVQKLKEKLIELKIPAEQIKIKTAHINEIKGLDLMSKNCAVRYIITINALKEGWDCPFAYILSSMADKNSAVDVEQILGRILRQPYIQKHGFDLLNLSYVLTASSKFMDTLQNIVQGLNKAGFSEKDYKITDAQKIEINAAKENSIKPFFEDEKTEEIEVERINNWQENLQHNTLESVEKFALEQNEIFNKNTLEHAGNNEINIPLEIKNNMKKYVVKEVYKNKVSQIILPQFYIKKPSSNLFENKHEVLLQKEDLLTDFNLSKEDIKINFDNNNTELYKIDLDKDSTEHIPTFFKLDGDIKDEVLQYILDPIRVESRVKNFSFQIGSLIGNMYPIPDKEIINYVQRIIANFTPEEFINLSNKLYSYSEKIKQKIKLLSEEYGEKTFRTHVASDKIIIKPTYNLPEYISPTETAKNIPKSIYEKEIKMNGFEERLINEIANMPNIICWTKNIEKVGFKINGFINHYPDFIILTNSGKIILLETKGDHLVDNLKIKLGKYWAEKAGNDYRYFMVYEKREVQDAFNAEGILKIIRDL